jgi:hypothetical protein
MADQDMRHTAKIRAAGDRTISEPGNTKSISPPAQRRVDILTPGGHWAGRQMVSKR